MPNVSRSIPTVPEPPNSTRFRLSKAEHLSQLKASAIDIGVAAERGYRTVNRSEVPEEFAGYQRRAGLLVTMHSPDGITRSHQLRPDKPRKAGLRYEAASGSEVIIDVHPRAREEVRNGCVDLWITEGVKKADALVSREEAAVALAGVWMAHEPKSKPRRLLPCWDNVRLEGRRVFIAFDSDLNSKSGVQDAAEYLVGALEERGAEVLVVYLPDMEDGTKQGVDDFLASGGTVAELKMLAGRFEPADVGRVRMSRDARLRAAVEDLRQRWWSADWSRFVGTGERANSMRGHSCRDVMHALIEAATRHGQVEPSGVRLTVSRRTLAEMAAVSSRRVHATIRHLEAEGWLVFEPAQRTDHAGSYLLRSNTRARCHHEGGEGAAEGEREDLAGETRTPGGDGLRAPRVPRLRWSAPSYTKRKRGTVTGTCKVRESPPPASRAGYRRLGKINGSIIDLLELQGQTNISAVADHLGRRVRDLRRRNLPKLQGAGVVELDGDEISLTANWRAALEAERELQGEVSAAVRDRERHRRQREAFRNYRQIRITQHWTNDPEADGVIEDLEPAEFSEGFYRALLPLIDTHKRIPTTRGPGRVWQVFSEVVGIVLDSEPQRVAWLRPGEVDGELVA